MGAKQIIISRIIEKVKIGTPEQHVQGEVRINEKSDFPLAVRLVRDGQEQPWPQVNFSLKASVEGCLKDFRASRVGDVFNHCRVDGDHLLVFFDNHRLKNGLVRIEVTFYYPDSDYTTDGLRQETFSATSNIRLVRDSGDALSLKLPEPKVVEKEVPLPAEIKALSEARDKAMQYNTDAGAMGVFNSESEVLDALASEELLTLSPTVLHDGTFAEKVLPELGSMDSVTLEVPLLKQFRIISLLRNYANSSGVGIPLNCQQLFASVRLNNLSLTLRSPMDIRGMFVMSHFARLDIYLTDGFEIAKEMEVAVNSNSSHEDWVNYRNSDDSDELTMYEYGGHIRQLHLKFDPNKMEHVITFIRNLGRGCVKQIYLESTGDIDTEQFAKWLLEAIKPYTDKEKAIKDTIGDAYLCLLSPIGKAWSTAGLGFPGARDGFRSKGYII